MEHVLNQYKSYLELRNYKTRGIEGKISASRDYLIYCDNQNLDFRYASLKDSEDYREHMSLLTCEDGSPRYQPSTINVALSSLKTFYSFLLTKGISQMNPFADTWKLKEGIRIPKNILSIEKMGELLESLKVGDELELKVIVEILYSTGMRISELENLKLSDINLKEGYLKIEDNKERRMRKAPLTEYASSLLAYYLGQTSKETPFLRGKKRTLNRWVNDQLKRKTRELKLPIITSHSFRHSIATHLLSSGAGIREVQEFLGHKKIKNTEIYTRVLTADLKKVVESSHPRECIQ